VSCVFKLKYVLLNNRRAYVDDQNIYDRRAEDGQENIVNKKRAKMIQYGAIWA
jgi:hypothetical protein